MKQNKRGKELKINKGCALVIALLYAVFPLQGQALSVRIDSCGFRTIYDIHPKYRKNPKSVYVEGEATIYYYGPALFVEGILINESNEDCILETWSRIDYHTISSMTLEANYSYKNNRFSSEVYYLLDYGYDTLEKKTPPIAFFIQAIRQSFI